jgi:hypothetical protein
MVQLAGHFPAIGRFVRMTQEFVAGLANALQNEAIDLRLHEAELQISGFLN